MAREVPIGAQGEAEETVEFQPTLTAHNPALPPVYSTPHMVRLMEMAAFHALQSYCDGDEISVGTAINIEHRAASGIGARVSGPAHADHPGGHEHAIIVWRKRQRDQAGERNPHADNERIRLGMLIGIKTDHRLKNGADHLEGERNQANLREAEAERVLEQRINRRKQRLDGIIQQMAKAQRKQDA